MKRFAISTRTLHLKQPNLLRSALSLFAVLSPVFFTMVVLRSNRQNLLTVLPYWNDETNYFLQLKSMLAYGAPLGFTGFSGGAAPHLTFGFHGLGVLVPYYLFAKVFGLQYNTITLCNLAMVSGAILFYILALRPTNRQLLFLVACSSIAITYAQTAMMEAGFYAYMIFFAALLIRISKKKSLPWVILGFCTIAFVSFAKPTFAVLLLPLLLLILRHKKWVVTLALSLAGTAVYMLIAQGVFNLFSSPYWESHYAYDYALIKTEPIHTVLKVLQNIAANFFSLFVISVRSRSFWRLLTSSVLYLSMLYLVYGAAVELVAFMKTKKFSSPKEEVVLLWSSTMAVVGSMVMWTGILKPIWPTLRNCLPIFFFMITVVSALKLRKKMHFIGILAVLHSVVMLLGGMDGDESRGFLNAEYRTHAEQVESFYADTVSISKENSPWENTIASYFGTPDIYWREAPAGTGWNLHRDMHPLNEKYVLLPVSYEEELDYFTSSGFAIAGSNEEVVLLLNPKYGEYVGADKRNAEIHGCIRTRRMLK